MKLIVTVNHPDMQPEQAYSLDTDEMDEQGCTLLCGDYVIEIKRESEAK